MKGKSPLRWGGWADSGEGSVVGALCGSYRYCTAGSSYEDLPTGRTAEHSLCLRDKTDGAPGAPIGFGPWS
jgi:hypothetical protein